jgi:hypothetical protein
MTITPQDDPPPPTGRAATRPVTARAWPDPAGNGSWLYNVWVAREQAWSGLLRHMEADAFLRDVGFSPNAATKLLRRARDQFDVYRARRTEEAPTVYDGPHSRDKESMQWDT